MDKKAIQEAVEEGTKKAIDEKLGQFYIDREQHYQDHIWLKGLREWSKDIKNVALKTVVEIIMAALVGLMILGFIFWGNNNLR